MNPLILAFETSCDETAVAVVRGTEVLSSVLSSQTDLHSRFGGVVPEVAARAHVEAIRPLTHKALVESGVHPADLDAVAATNGPGLVGALLIGHSFAKATAWARQLPFVSIDHMEGHLMAPRLEFEEFQPPAVVLLASGRPFPNRPRESMGRVSGDGGDHRRCRRGGFRQARPSAWIWLSGRAGIDLAVAESGDPAAVKFPRALADRPYQVSFSGLKTSVATYLREGQSGRGIALPAGCGCLDPGGDCRRAGAKDHASTGRHRGEGARGGGGVLANRVCGLGSAEEAHSRGVTSASPPPTFALTTPP